MFPVKGYVGESTAVISDFSKHNCFFFSSSVGKPSSTNLIEYQTSLSCKKLPLKSNAYAYVCGTSVYFKAVPYVVLAIRSAGLVFYH